MSGSKGGHPTVFGVSLEELMFRVPPHPGAWKGVLAAERFLLDMRRLESGAGVAAGVLPGIADGIMRLAQQDGPEG